MCVGIPMQVIERHGETEIVCRADDGGVIAIDASLIDRVEPGDWVLTFLGAAREIITAQQASDIGAALKAVGLAMSGAHVSPEDIDALFPDLADRVPELPDHLKPAINNTPPSESERSS